MLSVTSLESPQETYLCVRMIEKKLVTEIY